MVVVGPKQRELVGEEVERLLEGQREEAVEEEVVVLMF